MSDVRIEQISADLTSALSKIEQTTSSIISRESQALSRDSQALTLDVKDLIAIYPKAKPFIQEALPLLQSLPFGWAKLLWRLKVKGLKTGRVPLMGVKRRFAAQLRGQLLPFQLIDACASSARKLGYERYELSWVLEDNLPMRRICDAGGAKVYKTYRLYEKAL